MYLCHNNLPYRYKFNKNTPPPPMLRYGKIY